MENIINQVQVFRKALGMKELSNPKKMGRKKLEDQLAKLRQKIEEAQKQRVQEAPEVPEQPEKIEAVVQQETIKELSCRLLCEVDHINEEGRTVGKPYQEVLESILEQRPEAKTSLNCLRWYAGKIRSQFSGYQKYNLPQVRARLVKA